MLPAHDDVGFCSEARMAKKEWRWVRVKALGPAEKAAIAATCERFIAETLKPRFLPTVTPTPYNYPVDIFGKWRGAKYSFITRYRSGFADNAGEEFDSAFTRLDHLEECIAETRFDVMWHRHTGQWVRVFPSLTLDEALGLMGSGGPLQPAI
jgi:hypothetical protein